MRLQARALVLSLGARRLLDGASLSLDRGEIITVEGASGSGKTTLLRVLVGLVDADAGEVILDGVSTRELAPTLLRRRIAYVPQQAPMLEGTVGDNLTLGPRLRGKGLSGDAIASLLEHVGLPPALADQTARELSGGERQRVALARALANEPEVLLLDEPTAALDTAAANVVLDRVAILAREGLAIVVVTHRAEHSIALRSRRQQLVDGRLIEVAA